MDKLVKVFASDIVNVYEDMVQLEKTLQRWEQAKKRGDDGVYFEIELLETLAKMRVTAKAMLATTIK